MEEKKIYKFTNKEICDIIEDYCIPVWEAQSTEEMARAGYVLACIVDYVWRQKDNEYEERKRECEETLAELKDAMRLTGHKCVGAELEF